MLREVLLRNGRRTVRLSAPNSTGHMVPNEHETEVGFGIPALVLREGKVDEIIK